MDWPSSPDARGRHKERSASRHTPRELWRRIEKAGEKLLKGEDENANWEAPKPNDARFSTKLTVALSNKK